MLPSAVLVVRAYRLAAPVVVENTPAYAGCKSWVPLDAGVLTAGARAVIDDSQFGERRARVTDQIH